MKLTGISDRFRIAPRASRAALIAASAVVCLASSVASAGPSMASPNMAGTSMASTSMASTSMAGPVVPRTGVGHAAQILDDSFNGDSCTSQPDNPAIKITCVAVGAFASGGFVDGLVESSANSSWGANIFGSIGTVTNPIEVSCVPQPFNIPVCVSVGEFFSNPAFPAQFVSTGGANGFSQVQAGNPSGATWSVLDDVSCTSAAFCMLVGAAGTTRTTSHGRVYLSHANAYRWDGSGLHRIAVPAPARATGSELSAVSCINSSNCILLGSYTTPGGRTLPYSALRVNGTWRVQLVPIVNGKAHTVLQGVSCVALMDCVAVGEADTPGHIAFAEEYLHGKWTMLRAVASPLSALISVSCPAQSSCVAAGQVGNRSLIEAWNGTRWTLQHVPVTGKPLTVDALFHVSCVTPKLCTAVGYRHNPAIRFAYQTLALGWNGSSWAIQKTINE
jgi:hypothetical protein